MEKLTKELLLQYAKHSSEKVRDAALNRICDELLKGDKGLLEFQDIVFREECDFSLETFFHFLSKRVLLATENNDVWDNFFDIVSGCPHAFDAVLEIYRSEKTPEQMKKRCLDWLRTDGQRVPLGNCIVALLKNLDDDELIEIATERCKNTKDTVSEWVITKIPIEKMELKLRLINLVSAHKNASANKNLAFVLLNDLSNLSFSMAEKFSAEIAKAVISALKGLPDKFDLDQKLVDKIKLLQNEALITPKDYTELLAVLAEGCDEITPPLLGELLPGLITCLKEDKKNFALVNEALQKVFAIDDLFLRREALYVHACIARFMKSDKDFKMNHSETFKQDLYRYADIFKNELSERFEDCYAIWFNLDDNCFLELVKNTPMFSSKTVITLLNFAANKTPKGWKKVFDAINWDNLKESKSVVLAVLNYIVLLEYDSIRFDAIKALQQLLQNRFSDEDADEIVAKLKKYDLSGIFKVLRKDDSQEIAKILNLLKEE